jgi:fructoselysine-6-P-deglycase FrlB-like protein
MLEDLGIHAAQSLVLLRLVAVGRGTAAAAVFCLKELLEELAVLKATSDGVHAAQFLVLLRLVAVGRGTAAAAAFCLKELLEELAVLEATSEGVHAAQSLLSLSTGLLRPAAELLSSKDRRML